MSVEDAYLRSLAFHELEVHRCWVLGLSNQGRHKHVLYFRGFIGLDSFENPNGDSDLADAVRYFHERFRRGYYQTHLCRLRHKQ